MAAMERRTPKRPATRRRPPAAPAELEPESDDDRFAPHRGQTIDAVYVIGRAVELIIARPREVVGVMLASVALAGALLFALGAVGVINNPLWTAVGIDGVMHPVSLIALVVLGWSCALLLQTPLVGSAIEVHANRRGLHAEFMRRGMASFSTLVLASLAMLGISAVVITIALALQLAVIQLASLIPVPFVMVIVTFVGMVVILVTALRVITAFSLVVPIIVVEGLPLRDALQRSWAIGWPNSFPMFLALVLPTLVVEALMFIVGFLPAFVSIPFAVVAATGVALYDSVLVPVAYVAIREYVDGLDPARLAARPGRR